jgi:hypothetical protein
MGFAFVKDEYISDSLDKTGKHIHAEFAKGGITSGPSIAGEAGPEAVVPLPDGRTIPVNIGNWDKMVSIWASIENKMAELVSLTEDSNYTQQKQLQFSRN